MPIRDEFLWLRKNKNIRKITRISLKSILLKPKENQSFMLKVNLDFYVVQEVEIKLKEAGSSCYNFSKAHPSVKRFVGLDLSLLLASRAGFLSVACGHISVQHSI